MGKQEEYIKVSKTKLEARKIELDNLISDNTVNKDFKVSCRTEKYTIDEIISQSTPVDEWISAKIEPELAKFVTVLLEDDTILQGRLMLNGWCACFTDGEALVGNGRQVIKYHPLPLTQ